MAKELAGMSQENMRHGAVITLGGSIQARGINRRTNNPYFNKNSDWLSEHAEMAALRRCKRTQGSVIYVARVNKYGEERMSRPCDKCMELLKIAGVKKIVYTIDSSLYL